ncbi:MAG: hypothetical protein J07HX5_00642 [halophilic archaeon J07HX5]|nr:MAG: hypothetical protein J07HX5_00642 [halophilic archaeon J07HX5]
MFQLNIDEGEPLLLSEAFLESRRVFNETLRLDREDRDWGEIEDTVAKNANLVQNTAQRVVSKAQDALENYYNNDDWGRPWYHHDQFPLPMNYGEGYNLFLEDDAVRFRISAKPYNQVKGELRGSPDQFNRLEAAMTVTAGGLARLKPCGRIVDSSCTSQSRTNKPLFGRKPRVTPWLVWILTRIVSA